MQSSSVKISNIFVDTSNGVDLIARFEITSMDHFTKNFNLTFSECELLAHLNISHPMTLPPNRSVMVNLTIPLPFYAEHRQEKCEGESNAILMMLLIVLKLTSAECFCETSKSCKRKFLSKVFNQLFNLSSLANIVDKSNAIVARRKFVLNPKGSRCLCLWSCACYCFESFITAEPKDSMCQPMSPENEIFSGFYDETNLEKVEEKIEQSMELKNHLLIVLPAVILALIVLLGEI